MPILLNLAAAVAAATVVAAAFIAGTASPAAAATAAAPKLLRVSFPDNPTGFDPAQISDVISIAVAASIFDAPLTYDYLARPARVKPRTAEAMPEVSADFKRFVFRIRPGILFSDDPAFKGQPRELTAADYVYSIKRHYDPKVRSPNLFQFENAGILGLAELRKKALADKTPFPYDAEVPGLRTLDRYSFEVNLARPAPRLVYVFASASLTGAVAREVIEAYPDKTMERPIGTGAFRLVQWKRGSRIVLEKNPLHRHGMWDETPEPGNAADAAAAAKLRGRALPLVDRVEIAIIDEAQPRWLAFLNDELDLVAVPAEFVNLAAPKGKLAPNLAKQGIALHRAVNPTTLFTYFGMEHPLVGGYEPHKVALRRAIGLGYDVQREIDFARRGQGVKAQSLLPPGVSGYDPAFRSEASEYSLARAKALLDLYGYTDRNNDGWRDQPDGQPLLLEYTSQPDQTNRQLQELWKKAMTALGVRMEFKIGAWPENIKASRAGKLMMWGSGWAAAHPDGSYFLDLVYGPNKGQANHSRFDHPALNALYERQREMPDGPERDALIAQASRVALAYAPYKVTAHAVGTWLTQARVVGYKPHPFIRDFFRYVDVEGVPAP